MRSSPEPVSLEELWWPPAKIAGRYLGPLIRSLDAPEIGNSEAREPTAGLAVLVELDPDAATPGSAARDEADPVAGETVGDLPTRPLLLVAPEDTLAEIAERMRHLDVGSAVVAEYGKTIGIITTRDMLEAFASRVHSSDARARAWMTAHPFAVRAGQSKTAAAALMTEHGIHHLLILDDAGHAVAIIGLRDVLAPTGPHRDHSVR